MKTSEIGGDASASVILINTDHLNYGRVAGLDGKEFCLTRERGGPRLDWVVHKSMGSSPSPLSLPPTHLFQSSSVLCVRQETYLAS